MRVLLGRRRLRCQGGVRLHDVAVRLVLAPGLHDASGVAEELDAVEQQHLDRDDAGGAPL